MDNKTKALRDVLDERARQDEKWGEQNHDPFVWGAILGEEVGEWQKEALQVRFGDDRGEGLGRMRQEAIQVAAVALAIVECIDRGKWRWGGTIVRCSQCGGALVNVGSVTCESCIVEEGK